MKFILMIMYFLAFTLGGIALENTGEYGNAFFAFYGALTVYVYIALNSHNLVA
jgi:hypothetical protein